MSRPVIHVINPNSNTVVTAGLKEALAPLVFADGPQIRCSTLAEGPIGIESQADVESVVLPLRRIVAADTDAAAFVIACYSDPGLWACREATRRPVFGIAECGVATALTRGDRFGVIAIRTKSIRRHLLEMSVAETASGEGTLARMIAVGTALRDEDGAEVVVMGCAGMARHRRPLEEALGVPVIDPTQAAVAMAMGAVRFG